MSKYLQSVSLALLGLALGGCEAPLNLDRVTQEQARPIHRFDQFKAAARSDTRMVVVGDFGTVLVSGDQGLAWRRHQLPGRGALLDVAACPDGRFAAVDTRRNVWLSDPAAQDWDRHPIDTRESPMAIACDPRGGIWVTASFSTLFHSADGGRSWRETTQDEDMQLTAIQFLGDGFAVVAGEFGAMLYSRDGGANWQRGRDLPQEFYPLAMHFTSLRTGWVAGLNGTILHTDDGGESWQRQEVPTKAPIYGLQGHGDVLYAAGDSGTLLKLEDGAWQALEDGPDALSYLIGMAPTGSGSLLVAGGRGALGHVGTAEVAQTAYNGTVSGAVQ